MAETNVECGKVRIYPIKTRVMRWSDEDPKYETTSKLFICQREPGHGGDHYGREDTEDNGLRHLVAYWAENE